jgi:hypothetical protein
VELAILIRDDVAGGIKPATIEKEIAKWNKREGIKPNKKRRSSFTTSRGWPSPPRLYPALAQSTNPRQALRAPCGDARQRGWLRVRALVIASTARETELAALAGC